jgi:hypothetical protein
MSTRRLFSVPSRCQRQIGLFWLRGSDPLAEFYLRAAGVAAVWIDAEGHVGAQDVASIENDPAASSIAASVETTSSWPIGCTNGRQSPSISWRLPPSSRSSPIGAASD